jgi:small-conductance mechanosensitive channel
MALRVIIIVCGAVVALALGMELLVPAYRPSLLIESMLSRPIPPQASFIVSGVLLLLLAGVGLLLISQRKATEKLDMRLRGVGHAVFGLGEAQKDSDEAAAYLDRTDPEGAISALQGRITKANEAADEHQARNVALDLNSQVEQLRQQQFLLRDKLGDVIAKRRTVETLVTELQTSQDDIERTLAVIEEDKNKDTLAERVQKISEFVAGTSSRFLEIERSLRELLRLKDEFGALQTRLVPLDDKETGVNSVLKAINATREELTANIERVDNHEGSTLKVKVDDLGQTNKQLDEQVASLLAQFSRLDTMHKDICGLFAKLNYAQNVPRGLEQGVRLISNNG